MFDGLKFVKCIGSKFELYSKVLFSRIFWCILDF